MGFRAVDHGVNVVSYEKNNHCYGMTCAWMMQVDYDKILCLLGSQSITGKNINKGDHIGISALSKQQKDIAIQLGENHSDKVDKLKNINVIKKDSCILIKDATRTMEIEVIDVMHLESIEEDYLIYGKVLSFTENGNSFLHMSEM